MVATRHRKISQATAGKRKRAETKKKTKKEKKKKSNGEEGRGKKSRNDKEESEKKALLALQASKAHLTVVCRPNE